MYRTAGCAVVAWAAVAAFAPVAQAAKAPSKPPPLPREALRSDPLRSPALEGQTPGNYQPAPDRRDQIAKKTGRKYCKRGPHNFDYANGLGGRSFSATLDVVRYCHQGNQVSEVSVSPDHKLYGVYNFYMRFDHESVQKGYYNYRKRGIRSGYFVLARFYFLYCYEPTRNACTKTYVLYLRTFVHEDGTSSAFRTLIG